MKRLELLRQEGGYLLPCIDGQPLSELVDIFERAKGYDDPAGGYGGVRPWGTRQPAPLMSDVVALSGSLFPNASSGQIAFLGCECGEWGCWPLVGRVKVVGSIVLWHSFSQPHRPRRDYSDFGPFDFGLQQYLAAVQRFFSPDHVKDA